MLALLLGTLGCEVVTAFTLADGLAKISNKPYDLYIFCAHLPDGSGIDLFNRVRAGDSDTPIIVLAASSIPEEFEKVLSQDGNYCVRKPFNLQTLQGLITRLLK